MIKSLYRRLPGPPAARIASLAVLTVAVLALVIWSYEVLGDLLDTGGAVRQ